MKKHKEFFRFLKELGVYTEYRKYVQGKHNLKNLLEVYNKEQYIEAAFDWSMTKEGHEFWFKIHIWWADFDGMAPENCKEILDKLNLNSSKYR